MKRYSPTMYDGLGLEVAGEVAFDFTTGFTATLWMKTSDFGNDWLQLAGKGDSAWSLERYWDGGRLAFTTFAPGSHSAIGATDVDDGQWHHVAIVYDGTQKTLYVDGVVDAQTPYAATISTNDAPVKLGLNHEYSAGQYDGLLDEVRVYTRALTSAEVSALAAPAAP